MTGWRKRTIMEMAREAGLRDCTCNGKYGCLERFEAIIRADERNRTWTPENWGEYERDIAAAEREACAMLCEDLYRAWGKSDENVQCPDPIHCADAIRNRGNT